MNTYVSTFISGFSDVIKEIISKTLNDVKIIKISDGIVIYRTKDNLEKIKKIKFFNNTFLLILKFEKSKNRSLENIMMDISRIKKFNDSVKEVLRKMKSKSFRIVTSSENQLKSVDKKVLRLVENKITKDYKISVNRVLPESEFWVMKRSEGFTFFALRITKHTSCEKVLNKGELRPEFSNLLCWLSEPTKNDIVLDPFCGYGSIPIERSKIYSFKKIVAADIDNNKIKLLRTKIKKNDSFIVNTHDFFKMNSESGGTIDKIITDPPWGEFEGINVSVLDFYSSLLEKSIYLLKKSGILVLLTSKKEEIDFLVKKLSAEVDLIVKLDVLVSGKKAAVYKILKK